MTPRPYALARLVAAGLLLLAAGCAMVSPLTKVATSVGVATGTLTSTQAQSINRVTDASVKAFERLTPEQEYYIGRSVAATVLSSYKAYDNAELNAYLNTLGQTLAMASNKPETFGGYHFLAIDTEEVNAFAAPGGLILVSRGLLRCCQSEDAVAAVLAHEVGHVQNNHGLQAINKSRLTSALTILAAEGARTFGGEQLAQLTTAFEGSISDITATMVNSGYARKQETEADAAAVEILRRVGYNQTALRDMLQEMGRRTHPGDGGFARTHPDPSVRIADIAPLLQGAIARPIPESRQARFRKAMAGV